MLKILIADDHPALRQGLRETLLDEFKGIVIEEAKETAELVEKALGHRWDLVISDLYMPGGGGMHLLEQLKLAGSQVPVIIISMFPAEQYAQRLTDAGAHEFIGKDALPNALIQSIQELFSHL